LIDKLSNAIKAQVSGLGRLAAQAKFATVSSVNYETGNVKVIVQPDGVLSGWIPVLSPWVGNGWGMICPPSPGDQVFVVAHEGDIEQGVVIGRAYSQKQRPASAPAGELWLVHQKGSYLKLCEDGTIQISGDLHVNGDVFDRHGALSQLRSNYDDHTHVDSRAGVTSRPTPTD
jgi:phage baseplate assembly protein gpV